MEASQFDEVPGMAGQFTGEVAVVIGVWQGEPRAATTSAVMPVSFSPPLMAVCCAEHARMRTRLRPCKRFSINMLAERDHTVARQRAQSGRTGGWERLASVDLTRRKSAAAVLAQSVAWLDCEVQHSIPTGDDSCVVGRVLVVDRTPEAVPLAYYRGRFHRLGESVAPAPWRVPDANDLVADW